MCVPGILSAVFGPFATVWPAKLLTDLARYLIAAGGLWALIWGYRAALIWPRKIQTRSAGPADMARALRYSAITVRIFFAERLCRAPRRRHRDPTGLH